MGSEVRLRFLVRSRGDRTKCLLTASVSEAEASSLWFRGRPAHLRSLYSTWAWQTAQAGVDGKQNCALNVSCISNTMLLYLAETYMTVVILEWRKKGWHHLNNARLKQTDASCLLPVYFCLFSFLADNEWPCRYYYYFTQFSCDRNALPQPISSLRNYMQTMCFGWWFM